MNQTERLTDSSSQVRRHTPLRRVLLWIFGIFGLLVLVGLIAGDIMLHRAGPMLKAKVIETLSNRFDARVELDKFQVSLIRGFEVKGSGLRLYPNRIDGKEPMFSVQRFSFHVLGWRQLFVSPIFINKVQVKGLDIHLPPKSERSGPGRPHSAAKNGDIKVLVGEILIDQANLVIENGKPGKIPLTIVIHKLQLNSVGAGRPMHFHATLVNPKPIGNIDSSGSFGPFNEESPGDSAVSGEYTFRNADLSTIKGIGGILSSDGRYQGQLANIVVDGETQTPDFRLTMANRPMPLNTKFHAIVDGTNGDTHLQPVDAWLAGTHIIARGDVIHQAGVPGKDIRLDVQIGPGHIQDLLNLAVKTQPPVLNGPIQAHAAFDLPPGRGSVTDRIDLKGNFSLDGVHFGNPKFQSDVDQLSLRGQGHAKQAEQEGNAMKAGNVQAGTADNVAAAMRGNFLFGGGKLTLPTVNFQVPGAAIALNGVYTLDGQTFNFQGSARLDAHVSQMVTGWKSWLLKPADPFFAKNGAGTFVPIKIDGTRSDPHVGLDFHRQK